MDQELNERLLAFQTNPAKPNVYVYIRSHDDFCSTSTSTRYILPVDLKKLEKKKDGEREREREREREDYLKTNTSDIISIENTLRNRGRVLVWGI